MDSMLRQAWAAIGADAAELEAVTLSGPPDALPSVFPVTELAQASAAVAGLAAARLAAPGSPVAVTVDSRAAAVAFTSERHLRLDGAPPSGGFAPTSGYFRAADGWVRTHANYPHHRRRLLELLGVADDVADSADALRSAIATWPAADLEAAAADRGALVVVVRDEAAWRTYPQGSAVAGLPLLSLDRVEDGHPASARPTSLAAPAAGLRVLDLTRVIAGPVAGRVLSLLGADVLRVDSPGLIEAPVSHRDTGLGKRSTWLDLDVAVDRARFEALLTDADVVLQGYRPGGLGRFGLDPTDLHARRPGLVVAGLSAWGPVGPWAQRRGFDSLVQATCGIAATTADPDGTPGTLPAQALDHATGYLIAGAVLHALRRRAEEGGGYTAQLSLAQTAAWLLNQPRRSVGPGAETFALEPWLADLAGAEGVVTHARPPFGFEGGPVDWTRPATVWGSDQPAWA